MSTTFRPRSKRRQRAHLFAGRPLAPQITTSSTDRCRIYVGESSFLAPYAAKDFATLVAQQDPASVIGIPSLSNIHQPDEFVRVGHISRVSPA